MTSKLTAQPHRLIVKLPDKQTFLKDGVHQLELVLQYGDLEEHVLMIDIHSGGMDKLPIQNEQEMISSSMRKDSKKTNKLNHMPSSPPPNLKSLDNPLSLPRKNMLKFHTCDMCKKQFSTKRSMIRHRLFIHLSQDEKRIVMEGWQNKCYFCSRRFQTSSHLNIHLLLHTKEKPHPCDKCNKKFNRKTGLVNHQRLHNPATRPSFDCKECDKSFTIKQSLTRHVEIVHLRLREFQCPECDRKFGTRDNMLKHLNGVHLGILYPCRSLNCGKTFPFRSFRRKHEEQAH